MFTTKNTVPRIMSFSRKVSGEISLYFSLDLKENNVLLDFQILLVLSLDVANFYSNNQAQNDSTDKLFEIDSKHNIVYLIKMFEIFRIISRDYLLFDINIKTPIFLLESLLFIRQNCILSAREK